MDFYAQVLDLISIPSRLCTCFKMDYNLQDTMLSGMEYRPGDSKGQMTDAEALVSSAWKYNLDKYLIVSIFTCNIFLYSKNKTK